MSAFFEWRAFQLWNATKALMSADPSYHREFPLLQCLLGAATIIGSLALPVIWNRKIWSKERLADPSA